MKIGDVVIGERHPYKMTIRSVEGNAITVNYFDNSNEFHEEDYFIYELELL